MNDRIVCRNPVEGKAPTTIARWKFDRIRGAILEIVPATDDGVEFKGLAARVRDLLSPDERARLGSVGWYVTTVKLELEVRGELERVPGPGRQRLRQPA